MSGFRKLPTWWLREGLGMKRFRGGGEAGTSIAALKCLLAITLESDGENREARVSYSALMDLTGLSRPMVARGVKRLEEEGITEVQRSGHVNVYRLGFVVGDARWAKVPRARVKKALGDIPNKGEAALAALKIYIELLSMRWNDTRQVNVSYDNLRDRVGVQRNRIRPGLDILFSRVLIHVKQVEEEAYLVPGQARNVYSIAGDLRMPA